MELRIELLGGFSVFRDGKIIKEWGSEQAKTLFKILLTEPRRVFLHEQLIEFLWPDGDPEKSLQFLRARVHALRQVLEPTAKNEFQIIETCTGGYRFDPGTSCSADIWEFPKLTQKAREFQAQKSFDRAIEWYQKALSLYRGEYLPEDRYEEWAFQEWQRWNEIYVSTLLELADCQAQLGRYRAALDHCRDAIKTSPVREDLYRQAMIYFYLMGNSNEALQIFQKCEEVLENVIGHPPDPQTRRLAKQITDGHVPGVDPDYRPPAVLRHPVHHSLSRLPFTGRAKEWGQLTQFLHEASEGRSRLALLSGEAGVGKTRLAQEVAQIARREHGFSILQGRCGEPCTQAPYQTLMTPLRNHLALLPQAQLKEIPPRSLGVLRPWLQDLWGGTDESSEASIGLTPEIERLRLFEAIMQVLIWLSESHGPMLLFLDDIHWADSSILDWMDYALSRLTQDRIMILATYREEEVNETHPIQRLIRHVDQAGRAGQSANIRLSRLNLEEIGQLLQSAASEIKNRDFLGRHLYRESSGNPLFLVFLLQSMFEERKIEVAASGAWLPNVGRIEAEPERHLPSEIQHVIQARIARLDFSHRALLESLGVIGANADPELLGKLWVKSCPSEDSATFPNKLESLEKMQIIYFDQAGYNFAHDKIREVVYQEIEPERRLMLHSAYASILELAQQTGVNRPHELLAFHYGAAGLYEQALKDTLPALKTAVRGYRNHEGINLAERALEYAAKLEKQRITFVQIDGFRYEILIERVKLLEILARRNEQLRDIETLLDLSEKLGDEVKGANGHLLKAKYLTDTTQYPDAQLESYRGLEIAKRLNDKNLESRALHIIALTGWYTGDYDSAGSYLNDEYKLQIELGDEWGRAETLHYLSGVSWKTGRFAEAEKQIAEALELREKLGDMAGKSLSLLARGAMYWTLENYSEALKTYEEVRQLAAKIGDRRGEARALGNLGLVSRSIGQYEAAIDHIENAAKIHDETGDRRSLANDLNNLGTVFWFLGEHKRAKEQLNKALMLFNEIGASQGEALTLGNLSLVYWRLGELQEALQMGREAIRIHRQNNDQRVMGVILRNVGEILQDAGEPERAQEHYDQAMVISQALKQRGEEMLLWMDQSRTKLSLGRPNDAFECSERALEILSEMQQTTYGPWIWYRSYQVLAATQRSQEAEASLRKAYSTLMEQASGIANERLRLSFLKNVPIHREIVQALEQVIQTIERSEPECYELLRKIRWAEGVICPHCQCSQTRIHGWVSDSQEKRYLCTECGKTFADRTGTVFANSNLPISKLFQGLLLIADLGISETARDTLSERLNIHPRSARNLHRRLAVALESDSLSRALVDKLRQFPIQS